jgi:hypothetical protein
MVTTLLLRDNNVDMTRTSWGYAVSLRGSNLSGGRTSRKELMPSHAWLWPLELWGAITDHTEIVVFEQPAMYILLLVLFPTSRAWPQNANNWNPDFSGPCYRIYNSTSLPDPHARICGHSSPEKWGGGTVFLWNWDMSDKLYLMN